MSENDLNGLYGLIEAGGTKFVCAVGTDRDDIRDKILIPTQDPTSTLAAVKGYFREMIANHGELNSFGVGCFGPININSHSTDYGKISETSKAGWTGINIFSLLSDEFNLPVAIESDVNIALLAEAKFGSGQDVENCIYVTIGTGIGAGIMSKGDIMNGKSHPEIGHILVPRQIGDTEFKGVCLIHQGSCIEGLASGPAIKARWGESANDLTKDHPAWDLQARYLADLCHNLCMTVMPERIILGGGVMQQEHLFPLIHKHFISISKGYCGYGESLQQVSDLIVPSILQPDAGIIGALVLAQNTFHHNSAKTNLDS